MRIEQYFLMTDYALWEVIVNGDSPPPKRTVDGVEQTYPPTTAEEKLARKNELKARERRTLQKQQYGNFNGSSSEGLDQTYDRLQKLISQLEILGETISQKDMNLKFLKRTLQRLCRYDLEEMALKLADGYVDHRAEEFLNKSGKGRLMKKCRALRENRNREPAEKDLQKLCPYGIYFFRFFKLLDSELNVRDSESDKFKTGVGFDSQVVNSQVFDSQENERYKTSEGYHVVPPPYTGNFMPPKYDLVLVDEGEYVFSVSITSILDAVTREVKTSMSKPKSVGEPLIEDWISDNEDENETEFKSK
ncbi:hypothetical protein Tco_0768452 [Tanacetum coccineum]